MKWWKVFAILSGASVAMIVLGAAAEQDVMGWIHAAFGWTVASGVQKRVELLEATAKKRRETLIKGL